MHLGYVSAAPIENSTPFLFITVIMLVVAVYYWKRNLPVRIIFIVFTCFALAGSLWGCKQGLDKNERLRVKYINLTRMRQLAITLDSTSNNGIDISDNLAMVQKRYGVEIDDAWDHPFRLVKQGEGTQIRYEIRSDGPDKTPGTEDDLAWPYEPSKATTKR